MARTMMVTKHKAPLKKTAARKTISKNRTRMINIRTLPEQCALIDHAATAQGKTRSDFMLDAAHREAVDTILNQTFFHVDPAVYKKFVAQLEASPKSNLKLNRVMQTRAPWE